MRLGGKLLNLLEWRCVEMFLKRAEYAHQHLITQILQVF